MRVGCGSATIGMFATQWRGLVDEVVVVDDHITGVVSEHQAGKVLGWEDTGIKIVGRRSTPGRYFKVSEPGLGWGGMPDHLIRQEIADGSLRPIAVDGFSPRRSEIFAMRRRESSPGPVANALWKWVSDRNATL